MTHHPLQRTAVHEFSSSCKGVNRPNDKFAFFKTTALVVVALVFIVKSVPLDDLPINIPTKTCWSLGSFPFAVFHQKREEGRHSNSARSRDGRMAWVRLIAASRLEGSSIIRLSVASREGLKFGVESLSVSASYDLPLEVHRLKYLLGSKNPKSIASPLRLNNPATITVRYSATTIINPHTRRVFWSASEQLRGGDKNDECGVVQECTY